MVMKNLLKLLTLLSIVLICTQINAQEYYADLTFEIQPDGMTNITGTTNYPPLNPKNTQELTSKIGKTWTLSIDTNYKFSEYTYKIMLPKGAKIQSINTTSTYFIQTLNDKILIEGFGEETDFNLKINYLIFQTEQNNFLLIIGGIFALIIISGILFGFFIKIKKDKQIQNKKEDFDTDTLTERQLAIIKEIEKKNGKNTQAEIQKTLALPKASLFRNIATLEKKGIIKKERKGMTMLLTLEKRRKN